MPIKRSFQSILEYKYLIYLQLVFSKRLLYAKNNASIFSILFGLTDRKFTKSFFTKKDFRRFFSL